MKPFINPYNFIPLGGNIQEKRQDREKNYRNSEMTEKEPLQSGWMDVKVILKTPLIIPDGAKVQKKNIGTGKFGKALEHNSFEFISKMKNGKKCYYIPGSSLHGMIRSAYEAVSDSCFPFLLDKHPIGQRVPLYSGLNRRGLLGYNTNEQCWELYDVDKTIEEVQILQKDKGVSFKDVKTGNYVNPPSAGTYVKGKGYIQYNIPVDLSQNYHIAYLEKRNLVKIWDKNDQEPYKAMMSVLKRDGVKVKNNPNKECADGLRDKLEKAKNGKGNLVPVWYFIVNRKEVVDGKEVINQLAYLSNSSIGRIAQRRNWADILEEYQPCSDMKHLCPACMLFGTAEGEGMKGRIRVTDAYSLTDELHTKKHILQILSSARPSSFEFYLQKPVEKATYWNFDFYGVTEESKDEKTNKKTTHTVFYDLEHAMIRGRKAYWHRQVEKDGKENQMNTTVEAVEKGEFYFKIYFDGITKEQLEQLQWVLTLGENTEESKYQHKLGHGKPLGYGSVKLVIENTTIRKLDLSDTAKMSMLSEEGKKVYHCPFDETSDEVQSFMAMCENGTKTQEKEVTYPYEMDKRGKRQIYGWFGNNHENAKYLMVLPKPTDVDISLKHHEAKEGSNNRKSNGEKKKENDSRKSKEYEPYQKVSAWEYEGTVKMFFSENNYGYIMGDGEDIKFYGSQVDCGDSVMLRKGTKVRFEIKRKKDGKKVAINCRVVE